MEMVDEVMDDIEFSSVNDVLRPVKSPYKVCDVEQRRQRFMDNCSSEVYVKQVTRLVVESLSGG